MSVEVCWCFTVSQPAFPNANFSKTDLHTRRSNGVRTGNEDTGVSSRKWNVPSARRSMTAGPDLELEGSKGVRSVDLAAWLSNFPLETSLHSCYVLWFRHAARRAGDTVAAQENTRGRMELEPDLVTIRVRKTRSAKTGEMLNRVGIKGTHFQKSGRLDQEFYKDVNRMLTLKEEEIYWWSKTWFFLKTGSSILSTCSFEKQLEGKHVVSHFEKVMHHLFAFISTCQFSLHN